MTTTKLLQLQAVPTSTSNVGHDNERMTTPTEGRTKATPREPHHTKDAHRLLLPHPTSTTTTTHAAQLTRHHPDPSANQPRRMRMPRPCPPAVSTNSSLDSLLNKSSQC
eukprot:scaffold314630_cov32-Tisochrysis_lutea.AAC.1